MRLLAIKINEGNERQNNWPINLTQVFPVFCTFKLYLSIESIAQRNPKPDVAPTTDDELWNEFIIHGCLITSVGCFGLFSNLVCLVVMSRPALRRGRGSSVNVVLTRYTHCFTITIYVKEGTSNKIWGEASKVTNILICLKG